VQGGGERGAEGAARCAAAALCRCLELLTRHPLTFAGRTWRTAELSGERPDQDLSLSAAGHALTGRADILVLMENARRRPQPPGGGTLV